MTLIRKTPYLPVALAALIVSGTMLSIAISDAQAWPWNRRRRRARGRTCQAMPPQFGVVPYQAQPQCQPVGGYAVAPAPQAVPQVAATSQQPQAVQLDNPAAGFLAWLNQTRAVHRLPAVAYDPAVEADCQRNNAQQAARGLGHHWLGCARRQNSAWNAGFPGVESMWMTSPGHASALLDPSIRFIGIAWYGAYCTYGAR